MIACQRRRWEAWEAWEACGVRCRLLLCTVLSSREKLLETKKNREQKRRGERLEIIKHVAMRYQQWRPLRPPSGKVLERYPVLYHHYASFVDDA